MPGKRNFGTAPMAAAFLLVMFLTGLVAAAPLQAAQGAPLGRISALTGKVDVHKDGDNLWRRATAGLPLYVGDQVRTGPASFVALRYTDGSEVRLSENTVVVMTGRADRSSSKGFLHLLFGMVWGRIRPGVPGRKLTTPTTAVGIKGTEINLEATLEGRVTLTLVEGQAEFSNAYGKVVIPGGMQSTARPDAPPSAPLPVDVKSVIRWINRIPVRVSFQVTPYFRDLPARSKAEAGARSTLAGHPDAVEALVELAKVMLDSGRPLDAVALLRRAQVLAVKDARVMGLLGLAWWEAGRGQDAETTLRTSLALEPENPSTQLYLAMVQDDAGKTAEAAEAYARAAFLAPRDPMVLRHLGLFKLNTGDIPAARDLFSRWSRIEPASLDPLISLGLCAQLEGTLQDAETLYRQALERDSSSVKALFNLASVIEDQGRIGEAISLIKAAHSLAPRDPDILSTLGSLYYKSGNLKGAAEIFRESAKMAPKDFRVWNNLGVVLADLGRLPEAERAFRKGADLDSRAAEPLYNLGLMLYRAKRYQEAAVAFRQAITRDPELADAQAQLGTLLLATGRADEARRCLDKAWQLDPNSPEVLFGWGVWYQARNQPLAASSYFAQACRVSRNQGQFLEALIEAGTSPGVDDTSLLSLPQPVGELGAFGPVAGELLSQALKDSPDDSILLNLKGVLAYRRGRTQEALACFRQALKSNPGNFEAHANLGQLLMTSSLGTMAEAEHELRQAIGINPRYAPAHGNLGNLLLGNGSLKAALTEYRLAVALDAHYTDALIGMAFVLYRKGDLKGALSANEKILAYAPKDTRALGNLAYLLYNSGNVDRALKIGARAVELDPASGTLHYNYGWVLYFSGNRPGGLAEIKVAARLEPDSFEGKTAAALAFLEEDNREQCRVMLDQALALFPGFGDALFLKGQLEERAGDPRKGLEYYQAALRSDPNHRNAREAISRLSGGSSKP